MTKCQQCGRDPERANSQIAECSVVDCPHRRHAWSDRELPSRQVPQPVRAPVEDLFDDPYQQRRR